MKFIFIGYTGWGLSIKIPLCLHKGLYLDILFLASLCLERMLFQKFVRLMIIMWLNHDFVTSF